jgi:hypothetical protein
MKERIFLNGFQEQKMQKYISLEEMKKKRKL